MQGADSGGAAGAPGQNVEAGSKAGSRDATAGRKRVGQEEEQEEGEEGEEEEGGGDEDEKSARDKKPRGSTTTKISLPSQNGCYAEGTMVILDCNPDAKRGARHPTIPLQDLIGRPVSSPLDQNCILLQIDNDVMYGGCAFSAVDRYACRCCLQRKRSTPRMPNKFVNAY